MKIMSRELLDCPFCGSSAEYGETKDGGHFVQCRNEMCSASSQLIYPEKTDYKTRLREVWNERANKHRLVHRD